MECIPLAPASATAVYPIASVYTEDNVLELTGVNKLEYDEYCRFFRNCQNASGILAFHDFCNIFLDVSNRHHHLWFAYSLCNLKTNADHRDRLLYQHLQKTILPVRLPAPHYCNDCSDFVVTCKHYITKQFSVSSAQVMYNLLGALIEKEHSVTFTHWHTKMGTFVLALYGLFGKTSYYAAWRSLWWQLGHEDSNLVTNLTWFSRFMLQGDELVRTEKVDAQGLDAIGAQIISIFETVRTTLTTLVDGAKTTISQIMSAIIGALISLGASVYDFPAKLTEGLFTIIDKNCPQVIKDFPFAAMIKSCVRHWLGYKIQWILLELVFDVTVLNFVKNWTAPLRDAFWNAVENGGISTGIVKVDDLGLIGSDLDEYPAPTPIGAGLCDSEEDTPDGKQKEDEVVLGESGGLVNVVALMATAMLISPGITDGLDADYVRKLLQNVTIAGNAFSKVQVTEALENLCDYVAGTDANEREEIRLGQLYPRALEMVNLHRAYIVDQELTAARRSAFRALYSDYLLMITRAPEKDRVILAQITQGVRSFISSEGLTTDAQARKQPQFWLFQGQPGLGKSTCAYQLARTIATAFARDAKSGYSPEDFFYAPTPTDKYCSSYRSSKSIWYFDDFLQRKDTINEPSPSLRLLFDLVTTSSFSVLMADVASKGMQGNCHVCVGATNGRFNDIGWMASSIHSIQDPSAVRRRISHLVVPIVRQPYRYDEKRRCILDPSGFQIEATQKRSFDEVFDFEVFGVDGKPMLSPIGAKYWTWGDIVKTAYRGAVSCRDFNSDDVKDMDLDHCTAEGLWEKVLPYFRRECTCAAHERPISCICKKDRPFYNNKIADIMPLDETCDAVDYSEDYEPSSVYPTHYVLHKITPHEHEVCKKCHHLLLEENHCSDPSLTEFFLPRLRRGEKAYFSMLGSDLQSDEHGLEHWCGTPVHKVRNRGLPWLLNLAKVLGVLVCGIAVYKTARALYEAINSRNAVRTPIEQDADGSYIMDAGERVEVQGRYRITANGKAYIVITLKNGDTKVYPEGREAHITPKYDHEKHGPLFCPRVEQQVPHISNNLWALVNSDDELVGNLFALDSHRFIAPAHVGIFMLESDFVLVRDKERRPFMKGSNVFVQVHDNPLIDLCVVEFLSTSITHNSFTRIRDLRSYLARAVPATGFASLCVRGADGIIRFKDAPFSTPRNNISYDHGPKRAYKSVPKVTRIVCPAQSRLGDCGGIYITEASVCTESILGYHVAGKNDCGYFTTFDVSWIEQVKPLSAPDTLPPMVGEARPGAIPVAAGFNSGKAQVILPPSKGHVKKFKNITSHFVDAEVAPLKPFVNDQGETKIPSFVALNKLGDRLAVPEADLSAVLPFTVELAKLFPPIEEKDRGWQGSVESGDLPSMDRSAVCGTPLCVIGPTKSVACDDGPNVILTTDFKRLLDQALSTIAPFDWSTRKLEDFEQFPAVNTFNIKDESRPSDKAQIAAVRPYQVTGEVEFILQRRFFYDFARVLMQYNLAYCSALGLDPLGETWDGLDKLVLHKSKRILAADFKFMDGSFTPEVICACGMFIISLFPNDGHEKRIVHPNLPPLNRANWVRWLLIKRVANHRSSHFGTEFVPNRSHPSGSFLTTILNITWQIIMWHYAFTVATGESVFNVHKQLRAAFLGDDSIIAWDGEHVDPLSLVNIAASLNFTITSATKDPELKWFKPWDGRQHSEFQFLSRFFVKTENGTIGILAPERLFKMLCFCNESNRCAEIYPQVVECFVREFRPWILYGRDQTVVDEGFRLLQQVSTLTISEILSADCEVISLNVVNHMHKHPEVFVLEDRLDDIRSVENVVTAEGRGAMKKSEHGVDFSKTEGKEEDSCVTPSEKANVVTFGTNQPSVVADIAPHDTDWVRSGICADTTELDKTLQNPILIESGVIAGGTGADHLQTNYSLPSAYFVANALARDKIRNYAFLRCTVCLRIVLTSTPMVSGLVLVCIRYGNGGAYKVWAAVSDLSIEMDLSSSSAAVLKVPTVLPQGWSQVEEYDHDRKKFDFAFFQMWTLTGISGGAAYSIYSWLEDVDLRMPMYMVPLTSHGRRAKPTTTREAKTDVFATASRGVKTFQGIVMDVINIVDTAAKFAALVGLSTPAKVDPGMLMNPTILQPHFPHMIGPFLSTRLAIAQEQKTVQPQGTWGCNGDDMDVRAVCGRPGVLAVGNYFEAGLITTFRVNPGSFMTILSRRYSSHLAYVALFFRMWRGSIKYRISLAKTSFHAGVIEVIYQPGSLNQVTDTTEAAFNHRWSWDITQSSSFEFEVPYSSCLPWNDVVYTDTSLPYAAPTDLCDLTGTVTLIGTVAPSIVATLSDGSAITSPNIPYVIYTWSDDIEFAVPANAWTNLITYPASPRPEVGPWSDNVPEGEQCSMPTALFKATPPSVVTNASCIGESIPNLRLLTRRLQDCTWQPTIGLGGVLLSNEIIRALSFMYNYVTGGYRVLWHSSDPLNNHALISRWYRGNSAVVLCKQQYSFTMGESIAADCPWQYPVPFMYTRQVSLDGTGMDLLHLSLTSTGSPTFNPAQATCGADDFSFGMLIAPPIIDTDSEWISLPEFDYCEPPDFI